MNYSYLDNPVSIFDYVMGTGNQERASYTPRANVTKTDKFIKIEVEVPGFSRSDIRVETKGKTLTVTARKESEKANDKQTYVTHEFNSTSLARSWSLSNSINAENIEAAYEAGILTLTLPYRTESIVEARRIEIN